MTIIPHSKIGAVCLEAHFKALLHILTESCLSACCLHWVGQPTWLYDIDALVFFIHPNYSSTNTSFQGWITFMVARISFLMSSLKRDCREVFVWIATHVDHMVLCCPITYVHQIKYQSWTFRSCHVTTREKISPNRIRRLIILLLKKWNLRKFLIYRHVACVDKL